MEENKFRQVFTVTVGEKGQIVIPKLARDAFNIKPGDSLILFADSEKGMAIPPKDQFDDLHKKIFGD